MQTTAGRPPMTLATGNWTPGGRRRRLRPLPRGLARNRDDGPGVWWSVYQVTTGWSSAIAVDEQRN
jgi:hypothetical protein